jgi:hypothetical protein
LNQEYESAILETYPEVYRSFAGRFRQGERFLCGDGWSGIVATLSKRLEAATRRVPMGAVSILDISESCGVLKISVGGESSPETWSLLERAQVQSARTCELCGAEGTIRPNRKLSCVRTLCATCAEAEGFLVC